MAVPVYSHQFVSAYNATAFPIFGSVEVVLPVVWDVRDITVFNDSTALPIGAAGNGFYVQTGDFVSIYSVHPALIGYPYHWEGRRILGEGQVIEWALFEQGWGLSIMGYQLTLP